MFGAETHQPEDDLVEMFASENHFSKVDYLAEKARNQPWIDHRHREGVVVEAVGYYSMRGLVEQGSEIVDWTREPDMEAHFQVQIEGEN